MKLIIAYFHDFVMDIMVHMSPAMTRAEYLDKMSSAWTDVLACALFAIVVTVVGAMAIGLITYSIHGIIWGKSSKS